MSSDRFWTAFYFLFMPDNVVLKIRPSPRCRSPRKEIFVLVYAVFIDVAMILFLPRYGEFSKSKPLYQKRVSCKDRASRQLKINELILTLSYATGLKRCPFRTELSRFVHCGKFFRELPFFVQSLKCLSCWWLRHSSLEHLETNYPWDYILRIFFAQM